jgi:hypothetical protein
MEELQNLQSGQPTEVNPFFTLYSILEKVNDNRYTDSEIREELKKIAPKLMALFSQPLTPQK